MKPIIIDESHKEEINKVLHELQAKSKKRTIKDYDKLVELIQEKTEGINISKSVWDKCRLSVHVGRETNFAKAYDYTPNGTYAVVQFGKDGKGRLLEVGRDDCRSARYDYLYLTDKAKESLLRGLGVTNSKVDDSFPMKKTCGSCGQEVMITDPHEYFVLCNDCREKREKEKKA